MVEVTIDSVRVSLMSQQRVVILKEVGSDRFLPIWIGPYEAEAITIRLQEMEVIRPLTHDLLRSVIRNLQASVLRVVINELRDDVFYARIILDRDGEQIEIDSRPSDAIALAVRANVPIFVTETVLKEAGAEPEAEIQSAPSAEEEDEETDDRLDVFKDFVDTLHLDDMDDSAGESDPESDH
ncbi:MAG: bifunctional nuclease family protein [Anaerolineales bacterium]|nr:bifunctional nuclease family protein [Anaerolineales bacterium]